MPLRIGVNALYLLPGGVGGTEIYLRSLLAAIAEIDQSNEYFVYTNREAGSSLVPPKPNFHHVLLSVRAAIRPARLLWEQTVLPNLARRDRIHVLFNPGFTSPFLPPCPMVTVFHDLQHKRHPEYFRWFDLPFWRLFLYASAHRSDFLLAVSDATRADILHYYRLPEERVRTVPSGVDPVFFDLGRLRRAVPPEPYLLSVSTLHPHKNHERLIRAFAGFSRQRPEFRLILAGMRGFHTSPVEHLIRNLGLGDRVVITGWIPDEELHELYLKAWAFVYPSTFEGFGLPVLEALACGIPTACSAIEPLSGIAGDAALRFDPLDVSAIAAALSRLIEDGELRCRLQEDGPKRARLFPWRKTAEATIELLFQAAGQKLSRG